MPRYELPPDLSPEEERAVLQALERTLGSTGARPSPWAMAGRVEALGLGSLQARRHAAPSWRSGGAVPFARRGTPSLQGRGDSK
jgi:hypothetical protein